MTMLHGFLFAGLLVSAAPALEPHQATGVKVGEVTETSAIVWMRLTAESRRRSGSTTTLPADGRVEDMGGACPGAPGRVRVRYGLREDLADAKATDWVEVSAATDFTHSFRLMGLKPATVYHYAADTAGPGGTPQHGSLHGRFATAPPPSDRADVVFTVITGQMYKDLDSPEGYRIYDAMAALKPAFLVPTGDTVYYDNEEPIATTPALARYHWQRMYSLPRLVAFHLRVPGYWEKDDHDTFYNDCWPTREVPEMAPMTFAEGQRIFREQAPVGDTPYRTFRWGRALQIWLTEGRDFRSPNTMPDGPDKTIWGATQKRWLKETLLASDADWKVLISPTPIVGPDRKSKSDNHANRAFGHEGNEFRQWVKGHLPKNFFIACGDRHWQYHSVDPATGVQEFACGPASDEHAGGSPGLDRSFHRFHRVKGGFLSVSVKAGGGRSEILFRLHDAEGRVVYAFGG